ncbi:helix-turn-helix domain-containing protein [Arthrobacter castelli]|uniref:helix-turn-helix domain-containing protein n=1 Tax=Arthrobacter castelli TaxID=271431 RepID=UPI0003F650C4|nr:helix-turn-helix domain-containing protein [Arthrobacter castelli]
MKTTYSPDIAEILSRPTCKVDDAATVLSIGRRQAYDAVHRGEIPSLRIGNRILVPTRKLAAMLEGDDSAA